MHTKRIILPLLVFMLGGKEVVSHGQSNWPQFRGPNGHGIAANGSAPTQFGATNLSWKSVLPPGHSSPCIWGDRLFLTAFENDKLETLCLDRQEGRILWRVAATAEKIEPVHRIGSPASPTPATN